jgi:4-hydroxybenzoate polyprenyltransferase/phosphoserine phosphatase
MQSHLSPQSTGRPLCVDLDGTLVQSDLLMETILALLKQNPLYLFLLPLWLTKGKAHFKRQIADRVELDASLLPYHTSFLDYLKGQHALGRPLILATAANIKIAQAVASHLRLFDHILASDAQTNLYGWHKYERLKSAFGEKGFDYAGNSKVDLIIWPHAGEAILVNPERGVRQAAERLARVTYVFEDQGSRLTGYLRAVRLHQWVKNALVFLPLALAHQLHEPVLLFKAALGFVTFGLCASSVYLLNDLLDLPADRQHASKRHRPFASGRISLVHGAALIPCLLAAAMGVALWLPTPFLGVLGLYYALTLAYSFSLKRVVLLDVLVLASLYSLRMMAGGAAVSVALSFWLQAFSVFLFLSLALVKRYTELLQLDEKGHVQAAGRGYQTTDLETLAQFGIASGYIAVLVLALYVNSEAVKALYTRPQIIGLLCPLGLYLISRIWLLARRGALHDDPVVFALQDQQSQLLVLLGALLLWVAM